MRKILAVFLLIPIFAVALPAEQIRFLYMKQSGYDLGDIVERAESFRQETGIRASPVFVEYEDRYNLILESAARTVPDLDLILVDLIWVADFAEKGIIDSLPDALDKRVRSGIVPRIYNAFSWRDRLWAIPFHIDFQMLLHEHGRHEAHRGGRPAAQPGRDGPHGAQGKGGGGSEVPHLRFLAPAGGSDLRVHVARRGFRRLAR